MVLHVARGREQLSSQDSFRSLELWFWETAASSLSFIRSLLSPPGQRPKSDKWTVGLLPLVPLWMSSLTWKRAVGLGLLTRTRSNSYLRPQQVCACLLWWQGRWGGLPHLAWKGWRLLMMWMFFVWTCGFTEIFQMGIPTLAWRFFWRYLRPLW